METQNGLLYCTVVSRFLKLHYKTCRKIFKKWTHFSPCLLKSNPWKHHICQRYFDFDPAPLLAGAHTVTKTPTLSIPSYTVSVPHLKSQLCSTWNDTVCNKTLNLITFLLHLSYDEYIYMMKLGSTEKLSLCKFFCLSVNNH